VRGSPRASLGRGFRKRAHTLHPWTTLRTLASVVDTPFPSTLNRVPFTPVTFAVDFPDLGFPDQNPSCLDVFLTRVLTRQGISCKVVEPGDEGDFNLPHRMKFSRIQAQARAARESTRSYEDGVLESRRALDWESVNKFTVVPALIGLISVRAH